MIEEITAEIRIPRSLEGSDLFREIHLAGRDGDLISIGTAGFIVDKPGQVTADEFSFSLVCGEIRKSPIASTIESAKKAQEIVVDAKSIKPPLGLVPKRISKLDRINEIHLAISRYLEVDKCLPREWTDELQELYAEINQENEGNRV